MGGPGGSFMIMKLKRLLDGGESPLLCGVESVVRLKERFIYFFPDGQLLG